MKKLFLLSVAFLLSGCIEKELNPKVTNSGRVNLIVDTVISGYGYKIIEVDSVEYLLISVGGIIKLEKSK